jgi:hypothetical protein
MRRHDQRDGVRRPWARARGMSTRAASGLLPGPLGNDKKKFCAARRSRSRRFRVRREMIVR